MKSKADPTSYPLGLPIVKTDQTPPAGTYQVKLGLPDGPRILAVVCARCAAPALLTVVRADGSRVCLPCAARGE